MAKKDKEQKAKELKEFLKASIYYNTALFHMCKKYTPLNTANTVKYLKAEFIYQEKIRKVFN